ncbi:MAG: divergent polysaccharide deacetylase family protein [Pseudomonadota bacterium]
MAKGFIKGTLWGAGVSLSTVAVMSVLDNASDRPARTQVSMAALEASRAAPGTNKDRSSDLASTAGLASGDVPAPQPDTLAALVSEALEPAAVPETGAASGLSGTTELAQDPLSGIVNPSASAPSVQSAGSNGLTVPAAEPVLSISTNPAQPALPDPEPNATAFAQTETPKTLEPAKVATAAVEPEGFVEQAPEAMVEVATALSVPQAGVPQSPDVEIGTSDAETPHARPSQQVAAAAPVVDVDVPQVRTARVYPAQEGPRPADTPMQPALASYLADSVDAPQTIVTDAAQSAPDIAELPVPERVDSEAAEGNSRAAQVDAEFALNTPKPVAPVSEAPAVDAAPIAAAPDLYANPALPRLASSEIDLEPDAFRSAAPRIVATQARTGLRSTNDVRVNRLPSLGDDAPAETPEVPEAEAVAVEDASPVTPFEQYSAAFEDPDGKPMMAVVLLDQGGDLADPAAGVDALRGLPSPVSIAVDPLAEDAPARMAAYRAAGFEVLAAIDLPQGATATDAEVNVSAALNRLSEVMGVLEGTGTGIQSSPVAGRQVADILTQSGHAFVSQNRGLNTAQKLAARQGVPSAIVFRDFDSEGQDEAVIRRFMDQAAFRAARDGNVVMMGRVKPETLAALVSWSLQDRAATVSMAPVSAVLLPETGS